MLVLSALPQVPLSRKCMRSLQVADGTFYCQKPTCELLLPHHPRSAARGYTGVPPVESSVAMQVCPYTVSTLQGEPCLFRCLHITLRHYCRFFRLKALRDMHGGGHDPEVLKKLCTAPDLAPRVTKVMAWSLGREMSTLVVQERHLWLCLVDIGTPEQQIE